MSAFSAIIAQGLASIGNVAGETVTYCAADDELELTNAVPGSSRRDTADVNEIPIDATERDWIVTAAELVIEGTPIKPVRGHLIKHTVADVETIYEVNSDGDQVWRYSDRGHTRIRVHTKEVPA